jgi:hypothetical protein
MEYRAEVARRLALLQGIEISPGDLESIAREIEDNLRIVAELDEFSREIPWTALQVQPSGRRV